MKIQCSCGAKYAFDLTPEMAQQPIRFVCQTCGLDSSEFVNTLIRQELANSTATAPAPVAVSAPVIAQPTPIAVQAAPPAPRVARLHITMPAPRPAETASTDNSTGTARCNKHGELAAERCRVCSKPICPKRMELFGYVCSPLCKAKADSHGIDVPIFAGQKSVVEARLWRKVALVAGTVCLLVVGVLGVVGAGGVA